MKIPFYAKLALVILLAVALAEVMPEVVNSILVLILIGVVLGHWQKFSFLASALGTLAK